LEEALDLSFDRLLMMMMMMMMMMVMMMNSGYFPKQKQPAGRCNADSFPCMGGSELLICIPY